MSKKLLKHSASKLVSRLSLIILAQTLVTFVGIWLLFFFPGIGANEEDLLERETRMEQIARRAGRAAAQRDNPDSSPGQTEQASAEIKKLFLETQNQFDGVSRQVVYRVSDRDLPGIVTVIAEWVDDLETGMRISKDSRAAEALFVRSMRATHHGRSLRVASELNRVTWYAVWVDDSEPAMGAEYVYQISFSTDPPILGGWRFMNALATFFLVSVLISLMMALVLQKNLSRPLKALGGAFERLAEDNFNSRAAVCIDTHSSGALEELTSAFNQMSSQLHQKRAELIDSDFRLRETNAELSKSKNFLETILESSPYAVIVSDLRGEIVLFNRAGRGEFGFEDEEDIPAQLEELFVPSDSCQRPREFDLSAGNHSERVCVRPDGSHFPALVITAPLKSSGGATNGYLYFVRDISESENFKDMMMRLDHLSIRGEMAGDIAHEINNFLAVIQGSAELLPMLIEKGSQ
ncbi:MAG: PAS domain S-box protein, partial [candidate division Zixibacteria bacterium]|nr:PAS domain S-box protein [candidate division Zixibacteria bacterium]